MAEREGDRAQADREARARAMLLAAGTADLPRPPWPRGNQPPSAVDLIRYALWLANAGGGGSDSGGGRGGDGAAGLDDNGVAAALALLPAARAELDQIEAALLFTARAHGLSWVRISQAMGLRSAQAAQQRSDRVTGRVETGQAENREGT